MDFNFDQLVGNKVKISTFIFSIIIISANSGKNILFIITITRDLVIALLL